MSERHDDGRICDFRLGYWFIVRAEDDRLLPNRPRERQCDRNHVTHAAPMCPICGEPVTGLGRINGVRYCSDPRAGSCYERAMRDKRLTRYPPRGRP